MIKHGLILGLVMLMFGVSVLADMELSDSYELVSEKLYVRRIIPMLNDKCLSCHGGDDKKIKGGLDIRTFAMMEKGGDSEVPAVVKGKPELSPLYLASLRTHDDWEAMPPKEAEKLSEVQLSWLHDWIKTGAAWPTETRQKEIEKTYTAKWSVEDGLRVKTSGGLSEDWTDRKYKTEGLWAYQPVSDVKIGKLGEGESEIDYLIKKVMPKGLNVAPRASRLVLIRRATYDLTGLPPTPEEIEAFINDKGSDREAFAKVVDRLLGSKHYGERMAQHWLDVVRYADSSGFANDFERGNAWRYRDYVIRAFNQDKPFNQFVKEQIAGDEIDSNDPEKVIAAGFLRMGPWELTGMEVPKIARQRFLDDVTNSVGETFLGHSLQCARCHDHKFDPVPTRDYYSIQAVFATTQLAERKAAFMKVENTQGFEEQKYLQLQRAEYVEALDHLKQVLLENGNKWINEHASPEIKKKWYEAVEKAKRDKRSDVFAFVRNQLIRKGVDQDKLPSKQVGFTPQQFGMERVARKGIVRLSWEFERYKPFALSVYNGFTPKLTNVQSPLRIPKDVRNGELEKSMILTGGDPFGSGALVKPGTLSVVDEQVSVKIPETISGRRSRFAEWVADAKNPLTTRVIVNRVWQWHFGQAIAGNPNNFGSTGGVPTHPELLDYLASTFVKEGWSIKKLHRRIMMSEVYQRDSRHLYPKRLAELDPTGKYYAVFKPRRLTAEELRDSMLLVSGELNRTLGGIPCRPEINPEVALQPRMVMGTFASAWVPNPKREQRHRRSIYALKLRGLLYPMLEVFNSPSPDFSCERREVSTVTPQVFSLFNSENSYSRGLALANRVWEEVKQLPESERDRRAIIRCYEIAYGRKPKVDELDMMLGHWHKLEKSLDSGARPSPEVKLSVMRNAVEENTGERFEFEEKLFSNKDFVPDLQPKDVDIHVRALGDICLVILNSNEFVYVY